MKMLGCGGGSHVSIADTLDFFGNHVMVSLSAYSNTSNDSMQTLYDAVSTSSTTIPACHAHISSVYPATVNGGVDDTLYIRGYQFGSVRGNGNIFFKNADDGGASKVALNATDMIWSDTLIKVIVPSINDTLIDSSGLAHRSSKSKAGSGPVWLITDANEKDSTPPITVFYSFTNRSFGSGSSLIKAKEYLIQKDTPYSYKFFIDSMMWNTPSIKGCVYKAIRDWNCLTGVNWKIDTFRRPPSDSATIDGKNFIQFGYTKHDTSGIVDAVTSTYARNCSYTVYTSETDMIFSNIIDWWFDTIPSHSVPAGKIDFYHSILHELGHAHSLNHVMGNNNVMFFNENPGPISATNRIINLSIDASCDYGGNRVMDDSKVVTYSGCLSGQVLPVDQQFICSLWD